MFRLYIPKGYDEEYEKHENAAFPSLFEYESNMYMSMNEVWKNKRPVNILFDELILVFKIRDQGGMHQSYD